MVLAHAAPGLDCESIVNHGVSQLLQPCVLRVSELHVRRGKAMDAPKTHPASDYLAYCQTVCRALRVALDAESSTVLSMPPFAGSKRQDQDLNTQERE